MNGLYLVHINWYDEYNDFEIKNSTAFVVAACASEAVMKAEEDFGSDTIDSITVDTIICSNYINVNMVYVPDDNALIEAIKAENNY